MVNKWKYIAGTILLILVMQIGCLGTVSADYMIRDAAELFYSSERSDMEVIAKRIDEKYHMNVLVLTDNERNGKEAVEKLEDLYERAGYYGNDRTGGIGIIIDLANRELNLVTEDHMRYFITDRREEAIYDAGYGYAGNNEYGSAMIAMLEKVEYFLKEGIPGNQYLYDVETGKVTRYKSITMSDLLIAVIAAFAIPGVFCLSIAGSYTKVRKYQYNTNQNAQIQITKSTDRVVNQFVTKRRIPRNPPSTGGGSGAGRSGGRTSVHRSSSGNSFGGGHGRKF